jgi:hypothetical protein
VALVSAAVSGEISASFIRVTRIELETTLALTSNRRTLRSYVLTRATRRKNPEDAILLSHALKTSNLSVKTMRLTLNRVK